MRAWHECLRAGCVTALGKACTEHTWAMRTGSLSSAAVLISDACRFDEQIHDYTASTKSIRRITRTIRFFSMPLIWSSAQESAGRRRSARFGRRIECYAVP